MRQKKDGIPPVLLYSTMGGIVAFLTVVFAVRSMVISDPLPRCGTRYANATIFPLRQANGGLMRSADIQAKLLERDWGLEKNGRITELSGAPANAVLQVALPAGRAPENSREMPPSGVGFKWVAGFFEQASSACMSYSVWVPSDFDYGAGGVLPSLYGGRPGGAAENARPYFAARLHWQNGGKLGVQVAATRSLPIRTYGLGEGSFRLPRGRWVAIEQEVILNTPDKPNGELRIWVDGELQLHHKSVELRAKDKFGFAGVWADMHYAASGSLAWAPAPKSSSLAITPIIVRWH
ncbi:MAG TPA: hypothetical protein VMX97_12775 [Hyphomicrobiaceae bacterium]|nr:hypothetical protein [Hyphomicrobiaceae bacterium]